MSRAPGTERPVAERIAKARREPRTQQALELTRALYSTSPPTGHRRTAAAKSRWSAGALQANGMLRDAARSTPTCDHGRRAGVSRAGRAELQQCGAVAPALAAMQQVDDPRFGRRCSKVLWRRCRRQGTGGQDSLAVDLHAAFRI